MIKNFNEVPMRDTAVIYKSGFEQIKKLYEENPEKAGELAIAMCEVALTGQHSSDDAMVDIILENFKVVSERNKEKYDKKKDAQRLARAEKLRLGEIAEMLRAGKKQVEIARALGVKSSSTISDRVKVLRTEYPELL